MDFSVIFEDNDILVINKPSGLTVNNSSTSGDATVQNMVQTGDYLDVEDTDDVESEFQNRGGLVHRLDKDTSGVLLIAKNEASFKRLQKQFKNRQVEKHYKCLVIGNVVDTLFEVNAPIARNPNNRIKYAVVANGKEAFTSFSKIKNLEIEGVNFTYLDVFPKTGRTHQIRVHLAALGFPVVCDSIYMSRSQLAQVGSLFSRLMLHAETLKIKHPTTGDDLVLTAPLPEEFQTL